MSWWHIQLSGQLVSTRSQVQIPPVHFFLVSVRAAVSHLTQWEHWAAGPKSEPEVHSLYQSTRHAQIRPTLMDPLEAVGQAMRTKCVILRISTNIANRRCNVLVANSIAINTNL